MIRTKITRKFINPRECLLIRTGHTLTGGSYFMETDVLPKCFDTAADAIRGNDDFIQAVRFDMETLTGEDVTEDCAEAWLSDWTGTPDESVPEFVKHSDAFERYCQAFNDKQPDPDQQRQEWLDDEYRYEHLNRQVPVFRQRRGLPPLLRGSDLL
ncbi:hypothetical protein FHT78_005467 [Rhizobium sp. BK196]|uniref:hypothetical protein n=1 Tax=Rhizobium sp. BK196 TaxID=2587073 RepID=UPI0016160B22|nr:hypothetical protein [Rhizobium sp. BK196]MBB3313673.1 hypothetical protein [Rhizobium sp. BK196]